MFQKNKSDYHTDPLYSLIKNSHPTLQERLDAVEKHRLNAVLEGKANDAVIQANELR